MVNVCITCGVTGFELALDKCYKCQECAIHRYCHKSLPEDFSEPIIWYCENCEPNIANKCANSGSQSVFSSSEQLQCNKCVSKFEYQSVSFTNSESEIEDDSSEGSNEPQRREKYDHDRSFKRRRTLIHEDDDDDDDEEIDDTGNDIKLRSRYNYDNNTKQRKLILEDEEEELLETSRGSVDDTMSFDVLQRKPVYSSKDKTMVQKQKSESSGRERRRLILEEEETQVLVGSEDLVIVSDDNDKAQYRNKCDKDQSLEKQQRFVTEEFLDEPFEASNGGQKSPNLSVQRVISGSITKAKPGEENCKDMRFKEQLKTKSSNTLQQRVISEKALDTEKPKKQRRLILDEEEDDEEFWGASQPAINDQKTSKFVKEKVDTKSANRHSSAEPRYTDERRDDMNITKQRQFFHDVKEDKSLKLKTSGHCHDSELEKKKGLVLTQPSMSDFKCSKVLDNKPSDTQHCEKSNKSQNPRREKTLVPNELANPSTSSRVFVNNSQPLNITSLSKEFNRHDCDTNQTCREKQTNYNYKLRNDISSSRDETNLRFCSDRSVHHEPRHRIHRDIDHQSQYQRQMCRELEPRNITEQAFDDPLPMEDPVWKGILRIIDGNENNPKRLFATAHLSTLANSKASYIARMLKKRIFLETFTRSELWPECFRNSGLNSHHIALYFFPDSRNEWFFNKIMDKMRRRDLAMRAEYEAELLIFTSHVLPMNVQMVRSKGFLWGVFRSKQR